MSKRITLLLAVVFALAGGSAFAADQVKGPFAGVVHATGALADRTGGPISVTWDRGKITDVSSSSITLMRRDKAQVSFAITSSTTVRNDGGTYQLSDLKTGLVATVVSQSGAYGGLILRHLGGQGIGVSRFLSIGNQVDVDLADALDYLAADDETRVVACFIEAVRDGRRFVEAAARVTAGKPMVVLKAGRTDAGRRAAGSHTGALAGAAEAYQAAFRRAGVLACAETEEFFDADVCEGFSAEVVGGGDIEIVDVVAAEELIDSSATFP